MNTSTRSASTPTTRKPTIRTPQPQADQLVRTVKFPTKAAARKFDQSCRAAERLGFDWGAFLVETVNLAMESVQVDPEVSSYYSQNCGRKVDAK